MQQVACCWLVLLLAIPVAVHPVPMTVEGDPFTLVATSSGPQLFGLAADEQGRIYIGNNSNDTIGIAVQLFDPALFSGEPVTLQDLGPAAGDADGIAFSAGFIYVADRDEGIRKLDVSNGSSSLFMAGQAINATGSPIVVRPQDGHLFVGLGGLSGVLRIDEYDPSGTFVKSHATGTDVETMIFEPASGLIFYAAFGSTVRSLDPATGEDRLVGTSTGVIDGGLAFDETSGRLFVGTANGMNSGRVETMHPVTGTVRPFASGFNGSLGILRAPATGDLFFLEQNRLYRLDSMKIVERVELPGSVLFDLDSDRLKPEAMTALDQVLLRIRSKHEAHVTVEGHTDNQGTDQYNQSLSRRRAQSVADYLVAQGLARHAIEIRGYGESQPVASNDTADGRRKNRRVEILFRSSEP
ncbi:MAG: OmpA family protein [Acidobacteriota bacterium]